MTITNLFNSTKGCASGVYHLPGRSDIAADVVEGTSLFQTITSTASLPTKAWSIAKNYVSQPIARGIIGAVKVLPGCKSLYQRRCQAIAKRCAEVSIFTFSGYLPKKVYTSFDDLSNRIHILLLTHVGPRITEVIQAIFRFIFIWSKDKAVSQVGEAVFYPVVSLLQDKLAEQILKGCIETAIDTGLTWGAAELAAEQNVVTVADKVLTAVKVGAYAYAYGKPIYYGSKCVINAFVLKKQVSTINNLIETLDLKDILVKCGSKASEKVVKAALVTLLLACNEAGALSGINLSTLFADKKALQALVTAALTLSKR